MKNILLLMLIVAAAAWPAAATITGHIVRVEIPGKGHYLSLAEVEVFSGGRNVALKGKVTQSSLLAGGLPGRAVDGNTSGDYNTGTITHTDLSTDPWWELDLGADTEISRIVVWNRVPLGERLDGCRVLILDSERLEKQVFAMTKAERRTEIREEDFARGSGKVVRQDTAVTTAVTATATPSSFDADAMRRAIRDMATSWPGRFDDSRDLLTELDSIKDPEAARVFQRKVLLRNPLLDFDKVLFVQRDAISFGRSLPANWQSNSNIPKKGYDNQVAVFSIKDPDQVRPLVRPEDGAFVGDVDLHFDAAKILFSSIGSNGAWQVFEADTDTGDIRQVTQTAEAGINNYDSCYLPDGRILFTSTAPMVAVPCVNGKAPVATLFVADADGGNMRQLCFDQEHCWNPQVMADGRVLYQRWEYADLPHANSRILFTMNPDGTNQRAIYGSNSWWPNSCFYARPVPGHPAKIVGIVSGHHGRRRMGELVLFDTLRGHREADGVVQRIPGYGKKVEPVVADRLVDQSQPAFLHPYPLSDKYFLVSAQIGRGRWGIYLADVFDNMTLLKEEPGYALLEPIPLKKSKTPPIRPDKTDSSNGQATVFISDIYEGPGLAGIPRGTVKKLRVYTYTFGYNRIGGLLGTIGADGPWDMRRILGTVPVETDGSAVFTVPANTPIAIQPVDEEGKALQIMRSWFTAMPSESLSCIGCHEPPNTAQPVRRCIAAGKAPAAIQPWHGESRNFSFAREVQPVIDRHCVGCHDGEPREDGRKIPSLRGDRTIRFVSKAAGSGGGADFSEAYFFLHRYLRRPGIESGMRMHSPMEFHADTTELFMLLRKGHHGVVLDEEAMGRLVTWFDLNAPYFGRWSEYGHREAQEKEAQRADMRARYANVHENHEIIKAPGPAKVAFIPPGPLPPGPQEEIKCAGWPFQAGPTGEDITLDLGNSVALKLVRVPAGRFVMGSIDGYRDEAPVLTEIGREFWIGQYEVTNEQYRQFDPTHDSMEEPRHGYQFGITGYPANDPSQPAVRLSWEQADAFCKWLTKKAGRTIALPTEAQWEWACRAGTDTAFHFGDLDTDFSAYANLADQTLLCFVGDPYIQDPAAGYAKALKHYKRLAGTHSDWIPRSNFDDGAFIAVPGGKYQPNLWGLHDMHGNVAEWTRCDYDDVHKTVRGGSWYDRPKHATSSFRRPYRPYQRVYNVGFRIILEDGYEQ